MEWGILVSVLALAWAVFTHFHNRKDKGNISACIQGRVNLCVANNTDGIIVVTRVRYLPPKPQQPFTDVCWLDIPIRAHSVEVRMLNVTNAINYTFSPKIRKKGREISIDVHVTPLPRSQS